MKKTVVVLVAALALMFTACAEGELAIEQKAEETVPVSRLDAWHAAMEEMGLVPLIDLGHAVARNNAKFIVYMREDAGQRPLVCELTRYTHVGRIWVRSIVSLFPRQDEEGGR